MSKAFDNKAKLNENLATVGGVETLTNKVLTSPDINGGTVDGSAIGGSTASSGVFTTLNATGGGALTGTWSDMGSVTTVDINGGTIDGAVIGGTTPAAGTFTTMSATTGAAVGGATAGTGGMAFPAVAVSVADANTLDDYEEGTWTPVITGLSTAGVGTYSQQVGRYTKIGNTVYITCSLVWSAHTGTGNMAVDGLPFASLASSGTNSSLAISGSSLTYTSQLTAIVFNTTSRINIRTFASGGAYADLALDTAATVVISGTYFTA